MVVEWLNYDTYKKMDIFRIKAWIGKNLSG